MIDKEELSRAKIGDRVTFKAATRSGFQKATRAITQIGDTHICVKKYHGWSDFYVRNSEIISIEVVTDKGEQNDPIKQ